MSLPEPFIPDWHSPRNPDCYQNINPTQNCDCPKPKRARRPYKVCRVQDRLVSRPVILAIWPDGRLVFHEKGRRTSYDTTAGAIYQQLQWAEAWRIVAERRKAKRKGRK